MKIVLEHVDPVTIDQVNKWGWTPLMHQARSGHIKGALMLIKKGANPNSSNSDGNSPLILAAKCGAIELIEPLIKAGADVNTIEKQYGRTAFHWAAVYGYESLCNTEPSIKH
jgi:uncharacterized protein